MTPGYDAPPNVQTPEGSQSSGGIAALCFRWYRCAQPPANRCDPSGVNTRKEATVTIRSGLYFLPVFALTLMGCQQEMARQPSYKPLEPSDFYDDGKSARPEPSGTVARGHLHTDYALFTGKTTDPPSDWTHPISIIGVASGAPWGALALAVAEQDVYVDRFPYPVTQEMVRYGGERFRIYCVVCHDALGTGRGKIVERGYTQPPSYHIVRLRAAPVGHFFAVITNGYGSMPSYGSQIPTRDRWAIVAYIRALQLSQHFPEAELVGNLREEWDRSAASGWGKP
jgi:mono/diheme cytochrome c family protein